MGKKKVSVKRLKEDISELAVGTMFLDVDSEGLEIVKLDREQFDLLRTAMVLTLSWLDENVADMPEDASINLVDYVMTRHAEAGDAYDCIRKIVGMIVSEEEGIGGE